jgi:hypothetical protein
MSKEFKRILFDPVQCRKEPEDLRDLLAINRGLQERKQVIPFFKQRLQLSAFLGSYHPEIVRYDLVAHELPLFGDFVADLVVGDSKNNAFAFIEFEDAASGSIFVTKKGKGKEKATPDWSSRFEHGFSQLVDRFFKLHEQAQAVEFEHKFGTRTIRHHGILIIGRTEHLGKREGERLRWRQEFVLLNSKQIHCKTFDQVRDDILDRPCAGINHDLVPVFALQVLQDPLAVAVAHPDERPTRGRLWVACVDQTKVCQALQGGSCFLVNFSAILDEPAFFQPPQHFQHDGGICLVGQLGNGLVRDKSAWHDVLPNR